MCSLTGNLTWPVLQLNCNYDWTALELDTMGAHARRKAVVCLTRQRLLIAHQLVRQTEEFGHAVHISRADNA